MHHYLPMHDGHVRFGGGGVVVADLSLDIWG